MTKTRELVYATGCALLTSCTSGDGSDVSAGTGMCGQFASQLNVEDKFKQPSEIFIIGEPITFSVRITNRGPAPATLSYDGCSSIRFVVLDERRNENVLDTLPEGTACTQLLRSIGYAAGETKELELEWSQTRSSDDHQVSPGEYTVNARDRSVECRGDLDRAESFAIR